MMSEWVPRDGIDSALFKITFYSKNIRKNVDSNSKKRHVSCVPSEM